MPEVVICEFMDEAGVAALAAEHHVLYEPDLVDRPVDLRVALDEASALIVRNRTRVDQALLDAAPLLTVVGRLGVGLDNIDLAACAGRRIQVLPTTGSNAVSVAEFVMGAILVMLKHGQFEASADVIAGAWPRTRLIGREVEGLRLGMLGFGWIGQELAHRANAFGLKVMAVDPFIKPENRTWELLDVTRMEFDAMIAQIDILSVHVPLTAATRGIVNARTLAAMPQGSYVINTARGGVVDEGALIDALRSGHLGGAFLDVFETEPLPAGSKFAGVPNLYLSPHVAGITHEANLRSSLMVAENVGLVLAGEPANVADAAASSSVAPSA